MIIEKPFGRDLDSARLLNATLRSVFEERQVYRIDHYLGKETVQDLLVQRFANAIFEPLWNRNFIDSVQITVAEDVGVGTRAGYYEQSGCLRDMIQNHTMQLLALTAMEPPVSLDAESVRDKKVKVLKAIQPLVLGPGGDVPRPVRAGDTAGRPFRDTSRRRGSPRFLNRDLRRDPALDQQLEVAGGPVLSAVGQAAPRRVSEIAMRFGAPRYNLPAEGGVRPRPEHTLISDPARRGPGLILNAKIPGLETRTQPVKMNFRYATTFGSNTPEAYERLVLDAMIGDGTLFIRGDEAETSWKLYTPVLNSWQSEGRNGMGSYDAGSWGPPCADELLSLHGLSWRKP